MWPFKPIQWEKAWRHVYISYYAAQAMEERTSSAPYLITYPLSFKDRHAPQRYARLEAHKHTEAAVLLRQIACMRRHYRGVDSTHEMVLENMVTGRTKIEGVDR